VKEELWCISPPQLRRGGEKRELITNAVFGEVGPQILELLLLFWQ